MTFPFWLSTRHSLLIFFRFSIYSLEYISEDTFALPTIKVKMPHLGPLIIIFLRCASECSSVPLGKSKIVSNSTEKSKSGLLREYPKIEEYCVPRRFCDMYSIFSLRLLIRSAASSESVYIFSPNNSGIFRLTS